MKFTKLHLALAGITSVGFAMPTTASAHTINVVASFSILADVVKNIGGDHVNVKSLVPANGDPHDFEPSPDDAKAVKAAAVSFMSGEGLETWFARLSKAAGSQKQAVIVSDGIATQTFDEDGKTVTDPHVWNSASNVIVWVKNIEAALAKADPEDAKVFKANATRYNQQLEDLNRDIKARFNDIPIEKRTVLTSHDAFGYYGKAYDVSFLSPLGISTDTEASAANVASLIDQIKAQGIKVYFIENSNDPRLIKQIADATGAQPGGALYPESLSAQDGPASSYIALMRYNTNQIAAAISK